VGAAFGIYFFEVVPAYANNLAASSDAKAIVQISNFTLISSDWRTPNVVKTVLRVPEKFIDRDLNRINWGEVLYLRMLWPSLESTDVHIVSKTQKEADELQKLMRSEQLLRIELKQGSKSLAMKDEIALHIKNDWLPYKDPNPIVGFDVYIDKILRDEVINKHRLGYRMLVPTNKIYKNFIFFQCPTNYSSSIGLYCEAHINFDHFVYGQFAFPLNKIDEWLKIDADVRKIFADMTYSNSNPIKQ